MRGSPFLIIRELMSRWIRRAMFVTLLGVYSYTLWLMLRITLEYIPIRSDVAFLAIKQDYVPMLHYRVAFFIHVFSAILVLPAGYTQFSKRMRSAYPALHRRMGWLYVLVTVILAAPSGLVIGFYSNGGPGSRVAFCLLAILWEVFTLIAVVKICRRQVVEHERWMLRSFALALSAITLRAWKVLLVWLFHPRPMDVYRIVAWLGWTLNLAIAEWLIYNRKHQKPRGKRPCQSESSF